MKVLEEYNLNGVKLQNRIVRSATHTGYASDNGIATEENKDILFTLAENNVGLIITGHMYVSTEGKASSRQLGIDNDDCVKEMFEITRYIHKYTKTKIFAQLAHAGAQTTEKFCKTTPIAPSDIEKDGVILARHMHDQDIEHVIESFSDAAMRAKEAGFDGIQLHAAHGYLLSEFLSPHFNKRNDIFGQNNKGRARLVRIIIEHARKKVGQSFPLIIKMNSDDFLQDGIKSEDALELAGFFIEAGINAIELSGGTMFSEPSPIRKKDPSDKSEQFYYKEAAALLKSRFNIPIIAMGGIRELDVAEDIVSTNKAELVGMSRPLICEPELVQRWLSGETSRAKCISCNRCFRPLVVGKGLSCVQFPSDK